MQSRKRVAWVRKIRCDLVRRKVLWAKVATSINPLYLHGIAKEYMGCDDSMSYILIGEDMTPIGPQARKR